MNSLKPNSRPKRIETRPLVYMFVLNNCKYDSRVLKEAGSLARAGYRVRIVAVLDSQTEPYEVRDGFEIIRVIKDPIHYRVRRKLKGIRSYFRRALRVARVRLRVVFRPVLVRLNRRVRHGLRVILVRALLVRRLAFAFFNKIVSRASTLLLIMREEEETAETVQRKHWVQVLAILWSPFELLFFMIGLVIHVFYIFCKLVKDFGAKASLKIFYAMHRPLSFLDYYLRAYKVVIAEPGQIWHAHDFNTLPVAWWAKRKFGGKLVYDSHELYVEMDALRPRSNLAKFFVAKCEAFLIRRADSVITVSESIATELSKRYRIPKPVVLLNTPLYQGNVASNDRSLALRALLRGRPERYIILYSGGITFNRGLEETIASLLYLPDCYLVLMGYGKEEYEEQLRELAEQIGVASRFSFFGPVPQNEVVLYAAGADVGISAVQHTSLNNYYSCPNKLFEYILAGIPVVASNFPELRRIIETYKIGRTFNPKDPKDIARAIQEVLDPTNYPVFKRNVREAAKILNWNNEEKKLLEIYSRLVEK